MFTALALALALGGPGAQNGKLEIANVRSTYGYLGAPRPRTGRLPGDIAHFAFDIKNLKLDEHGRAYYSVAMEILDPKGEIFYKEAARNATAQNYLGGNSLPGTAQLAVPLDTSPGEYTLRVTIHDRKSNQTAKFEGKGVVVPKAFGLVRVGTFADREGKVPAPSVGVVGSTLYVNFAPVNFARDKSSKQPSLSVKMRVLDDKGKPTFAEPLTGKANRDVPEDLAILPMQFGLTLNRAGNFTVEIEATCELSSSATRVTLPLRVVDLELPAAGKP
jgi:hypothetical protein